MNTRFRLRRWATGLTLASLPLLGIALPPSSLADDLGPCAYDMASMACLLFSTGGAGPNGPCAYDEGSMACLQAQTAAGANCSQGGITPTSDCMWSPDGGFNYSPPAPTAPSPAPAPAVAAAPAPEMPPTP